MEVVDLSKFQLRELNSTRDNKSGKFMFIFKIRFNCVQVKMLNDTPVHNLRYSYKYTM